MLATFPISLMRKGVDLRQFAVKAAARRSGSRGGSRSPRRTPGACGSAQRLMRPSAARPSPQEGGGWHAARTDIPPRRRYNDGASLPRQDRNATQGGARPRPCRPFSSRHSPWAGADGRTRAASAAVRCLNVAPYAGQFCLRIAGNRPLIRRVGPTLSPTTALDLDQRRPTSAVDAHG